MLLLLGGAPFVIAGMLSKSNALWRLTHVKEYFRDPT